MNRQTRSAIGTNIRILSVLSILLMVVAPLGQALTFNTPKRVDTGAKDHVTPVIGINSTGALEIVWSDNRSGSWLIMDNTSKDGTTWTGDTNLEGTATKNQTAPDLAISPTDRVHVVWQDSRGAFDRIYYSNCVNVGSTFSSVAMVNNSASGAQKFPAIAVTSTSEFVVWEDTRNGNYDIYFSKSTNNGTTWSAAKKVDENPTSADERYPDIAVDGSGKLVVVWQDYKRGNWDINSSVSTDGGSTWSTPNKRVDDTGSAATEQEHPRIAVGPDGKFHVVWQDLRPGFYSIEYGNSTNPSSSWNTNVRVDKSIAGSGYYPAVAVDVNKMVHVVWHDIRGGGVPHIIYANITKAGTFVETSTDNIDPGYSNKDRKYPRITSNGNANIFIVWQSDINGNWDIYYTRNSNNPPNPPTLTKPANYTWLNTTTPTFNWTFTDPDPGDTQTAFEFRVYVGALNVFDSNVIISTVSGYTITTPLSDGIYNWSVKTRDTNGAWSFYSTKSEFGIDTVSPTTGKPTISGKWSSSTTLTWNWQPASIDNGSGIAMYYICIEANPGICVATGNTSLTHFSYNLGALLPDGKTYTAKVKAKDAAGNNGTYSPRSDGITVDLTAPASAAPTDEGKYTKIQTLRWDWTASIDLVSGIMGYYICIGTTAGGCDVVNNSWTNGTNYTINGGQNGLTYYAKIKTKDNATNVGGYGGNSDGITVDLVAPTAARPVASGLFSSTVDLKFTWAPSVDAISGIKGYFVYIGTLPDGSDVVNGAFVTKANYTYHGALNGKTYYTYIRAEDNATNIGLQSLSSNGITVDLTVPTLPTVYDEGLINKSNDAKCWWDASEDQESGVVKYQVELVQGQSVKKIANTTLTSYRFVNLTAFLQHGKLYNFKVRALNGAGNWSTWSASQGFWVDLLINDTKAPMHNGIYSNSTSIQWTWPAVIDVPAGIDGYWVDVGTVAGGHDIVSQGWTYSNSYLFTGGVNGQKYYLTVKAKDKAGNLANPVTNVTGITIDLMPPDAGPAYVTGPYSPTTNITFTWDPVKDLVSGVKTYNIAIGTKPYLDDIIVTSTSKTSFVFSGAQVGKIYYAKVRATDNAGNTGAWGSSSIGVQVDLTPPTDTSLLVPNLYANTLRSLHLEWTASQDNISGVPYYLYSLGTISDSTDIVNWTKATGTSVTIQNMNFLDGRTYYMMLKPVNGAGLEGKVIKAPVTIDGVAPMGPSSIVCPAFIGNTSITWKWSGASDDRSGIAGYLFSLGTGSGLKDIINGTYVATESYIFGSGVNNRSYYASIVPVDKAGNRGTPILAKVVKVDLLPPIMIRVIRAGQYTHTKNVSWTWQAVDSISGIAGYNVVVSEGDFANGTPTFVKASSFSYSNVIEGHIYLIQVQPKDNAGNLGEFAYGDGITVDTVAPTAVVTVNNNATYVPSRQVTLQVTTSFKDVAFMVVSNTQTFTGVNWEPYVASREWFLTQGDGPKDVYIIVRDASGLQSPVYKVSVTLKTTPPKLDVQLPSESVSSTDLTISGKTDPSATIFVNDKQVKVESDGSFSTTIQLKDGTNQIDVKARDQAGNEVHVSKTVNKEALVVPSSILLLLIIILLVIAVLAMAYAYSANRRLSAIKSTPAKVVEEEKKEEPEEEPAPARPIPKVKEPEPPQEEPEEEEPVEEVEEDSEDDGLTLEEEGTVKKPDILARIRASEDTDGQRIKAAEAEGSDEVVLETTEAEQAPQEEPAEPEPEKTPIAQVRCNKCSHLIPIYTTDRPLKIECPNCGKVGMIRK